MPALALVLQPPCSSAAALGPHDPSAAPSFDLLPPVLDLAGPRELQGAPLRGEHSGFLRRQCSLSPHSAGINRSSQQPGHQCPGGKEELWGQSPQVVSPYLLEKQHSYGWPIPLGIIPCHQFLTTGRVYKVLGQWHHPHPSPVCSWFTGSHVFVECPLCASSGPGEAW